LNDPVRTGRSNGVKCLSHSSCTIPAIQASSLKSGRSSNTLCSKDPETGGCRSLVLGRVMVGKMKVLGPNGFERTYTLVGSAGEHQAFAKRLKLPSRSRAVLPRRFKKRRAVTAARKNIRLTNTRRMANGNYGSKRYEPNLKRCKDRRGYGADADVKSADAKDHRRAHPSILGCDDGTQGRDLFARDASHRPCGVTTDHLGVEREQRARCLA
jgi:hypothetical protein